jgi:lipoprotein NlpD
MFNVRFGATRMAAGYASAAAALLLMLAGCANVAQQQAAQPAVDTTPAPAQPAPPPAPVGPLTYRVQRGDTLARIAQNSHCSVNDLAAWNGIKPSARVKIGQVLKIVSPEVAAAAAASAANANSAGNTGAGAGNNATAAAPANPELERQVSAELDRRAQSVRLVWPAKGAVVEGFQPGETRGIEIAGHPGDPVRAAADGKVVYAGTGLNEYGSLIIVQHNKDFLTAYSHNRRLLVKMGDIVRQGQTIAEMGDVASPRVAVLFEVRHDGMPVDPMPYLTGARS